MGPWAGHFSAPSLSTICKQRLIALTSLDGRKITWRDAGKSCMKKALINAILELWLNPLLGVLWSSHFTNEDTEAGTGVSLGLSPWDSNWSSLAPESVLVPVPVYRGKKTLLITEWIRMASSCCSSYSPDRLLPSSFLLQTKLKQIDRTGERATTWYLSQTSSPHDSQILFC